MAQVVPHRPPHSSTKVPEVLSGSYHMCPLSCPRSRDKQTPLSCWRVVSVLTPHKLRIYDKRLMCFPQRTMDSQCSPVRNTSRELWETRGHSKDKGGWLWLHTLNSKQGRLFNSKHLTQQVIFPTPLHCLERVVLCSPSWPQNRHPQHPHKKRSIAGW